MLNSGFASFVNNTLNWRPIHNSQPLLLHGLGGSKESSAKAGDPALRIRSAPLRWHYLCFRGRIFCDNFASADKS